MCGNDIIGNAMPEWKNYEEFRPDRLEAQLEESPSALRSKRVGS